jgi:hypothetical protein
VRHGDHSTTGQIDQAGVDLAGDAERFQGGAEIEVTRGSHFPI